LNFKRVITVSDNRADLQPDHAVRVIDYQSITREGVMLLMVLQPGLCG
jgi:hypothetical protein